MQNRDGGEAAPMHPLAKALLDWYDTSARTLPWRVSPAALKDGEVPDPYRVWLSEIMLQQTMVEAVKPFFARFTSLWPTVEALAGAEADDIMKAWAGLGYYSRARNLAACAKAVAELGAFPQTETELRKLPGLGAYTAASVAAIAFAQPAAVVDGNVERVMARMLLLPVPPAKARNAIRDAVAAMVPPVRPGDFAQGMMDLGATVCTPRRPACILCPWREPCLARQRGEQDLYPVKAPKADKPTRVGAAFVAVRRDGAILLRKRAGTGLLAGMAEVPNSDWNARQDGDTTERAAPFHARWREVGTAEHGFTHFGLRLKVYRTDGVETAKAPQGFWWSQSSEWEGEALPTVMRKAIRCAIPTAFPPKAKGKP